MAADIYDKTNAQLLLSNSSILFFGDSNMRALYKDLVWLLEYGNLIPTSDLRKKNEISFANDVRLSNGRCTNSCGYEEVREYNRNGVYMKFEFLTRVYQERFRQSILKLFNTPSVIVMNSCLWDISRYGPNSIEDFQRNFIRTMEFLKENLPLAKIIWTTTLPPSPKCRGGFLNAEIQFVRSILPFHIVQANEYMVNCLKQYQADILDFHYHFRFLIDLRTSDGIHWLPVPVRYMTNLLLTHLSICWCRSLPMNVPLSGEYARDYKYVQFTATKNWRRDNINYNNNYSLDKNLICYKNLKRRNKRKRRSRTRNNKCKQYTVNSLHMHF